MDAVKQFYEALSADEAIRDRAGALNKKYRGTQPDKETAVEEIVAFAKSEGYEFTAEDLARYSKPVAKELRDDELKAVSGGAYDFDTCGCYYGGYGKDDENPDYFCVCVASGAGDDNAQGYYMMCLTNGHVGTGSKSVCMQYLLRLENEEKKP
jgi:predicted ribosomally synthesized peptide with nif11-like leader